MLEGIVLHQEFLKELEVLISQGALILHEYGVTQGTLVTPNN